MATLDWLTARPIAHRGLHDAARGIIENTASAATAAIDRNYGIEVDLQITADGEAMVHHDDGLGRLTEGQGRLDQMTAAELTQVRFRQTADRMLRLGDLCDLVGGRTLLLLELKSRFDGDHRLPQRVAAVLDGYRGPVAAMSFDPEQMRMMRAAAPRVTRGLTAQHWSHRREPQDDDSAGGLSYLSNSLRMQPQFVAYAIYDLPAVAPLLARYVLGLPLLTWTVRSDDDRACAERWADQIIFEGFRP